MQSAHSELQSGRPEVCVCRWRRPHGICTGNSSFSWLGPQTGAAHSEPPEANSSLAPFEPVESNLESEFGVEISLPRQSELHLVSTVLGLTTRSFHEPPKEDVQFVGPPMESGLEFLGGNLLPAVCGSLSKALSTEGRLCGPAQVAGQRLERLNLRRVAVEGGRVAAMSHRRARESQRLGPAIVRELAAVCLLFVVVLDAAAADRGRATALCRLSAAAHWPAGCVRMGVVLRVRLRVRVRVGLPLALPLRDCSAARVRLRARRNSSPQSSLCH